MNKRKTVKTRRGRCPHRPVPPNANVHKPVGDDAHIVPKKHIIILQNEKLYGTAISNDLSEFLPKTVYILFYYICKTYDFYASALYTNLPK